jgi:predicted DsbA family dithiol-disulfide isomerase
VSDGTRLASVRQQAMSAQSSGMRGVPHFVIGTRELHGAQSPAALREALLGA